MKIWYHLPLMLFYIILGRGGVGGGGGGGALPYKK